MSELHALQDDNKNDDAINKTFTAVKIRTSVLPSQLHSSQPRNRNVDKCKYKCTCTLPIFLPFGKLIFIWNIFLLVILIFSVIEIPYSVAFNIYTSPGSFTYIIQVFIDLCLLIDIAINFRTAYIDKYDRLRIIHIPKLIAKRYLKTWFTIDFLSATPFAYIILIFSETGSPIFTVFRLLRIIKLIRIIKILKMFHIFRENSIHLIPGTMTKVFFTLLKTLCLMLLVAHYFACLWYAIGYKAHKNGMNSWIDVIIDNGDENQSNFIKYSYSFYWAIVTLFTTGYGDIHAVNVYEHWTCSVGILIGSCFFAYFISILTSGLVEDLKHQSKSERIEQSLEFCSHYNLPTEISRAVITHIRYYNSFNYLFNYQDTMNALPNYLKNQISDFLATSVLKELDIFETLPSNIVGQIALKLKSVSVGENRFLFKAGDIGKELFISRTGQSILMYDGKINPLGDRHITRGDVIGENCILYRQRKHSVKCLMWSEFYVLNIYDIVKVLKDNFAPNDAEREWKKIKKVIEKTKMSPIRQDLLNTYPKHRYVHFKTNKMENYQTYVDPTLCDDISNKSKSSIIKNVKHNNYYRTFSEEELSLQKQDSIDRVCNEKKNKKMSFKSVTNMFKSMQKQSSHSRNKKVHSHYEKKSTLATLAYSHVAPIDMDADDDYLFDETSIKLNSNGNHSMTSVGFFNQSVNDLFDKSERKNEEQKQNKSITDTDNKTDIVNDGGIETIELQQNILYRNIESDSMILSEKTNATVTSEDHNTNEN